MVLCSAVALAAFPLSKLRLGRTAEQGVTTYTVVVRDHGVDAATLERDVVEPLESALGGVPDMVTLRSVAEDGVARVWLQVERDRGPGLFSGGASRARAARHALAVRDAVDRAAELLPLSAERPEVRVGSADADPVYVLMLGQPAAAALARLLEQEVRPSFAAIDGVGRVEVAGLGVEEVLVEVDTARAASAGLGLAEMARQLREQAWTGAGGQLGSPRQSLPVSVVGQLASLAEMRQLALELPGGGAIALGELAAVRVRQRPRDQLSRVNGEPAVSIAVFSGGDTSLVALSRELRSEAAAWRSRGLPLLVLTDTGAQLERSLRELALAAAAVCWQPRFWLAYRCAAGAVVRRLAPPRWRRQRRRLPFTAPWAGRSTRQRSWGWCWRRRSPCM